MRSALVLLCAVTLTACATVPRGPRIMVLPGAGKTFEQFQVDDAVCRQRAAQQSGSTARAAESSTVTGAGLGTLLGAGLGAVIGATSGHPGIGAAIGAGGGLLAGTAVGAGAGQTASWEVQRRYDNTYQQCMYAKGNQIPAGVSPSSRASYVAPPPALLPPPPPPPASGPTPGAVAPPPSAAAPPPQGAPAR